MGQQEYEAFKAKLREWMNTHPDEYAAFEEAMNARDYAGCQSVIFQAMSLIPRYRRLMSDKANEGLFEHVDEIEQAARQHDLAGKIIRECEQPGKDSTLPAMLCWLYFGKSFERMVERCEELRHSPDLGFLQKMTMSATIRLLISRSIKLELRTKQDWDAHREAMRLAESDRVLEWAAGTLPAEDCRRKEKTRSAEYDQIIGGHVFTGCHASRRVAAKDRRIHHEETHPDRHRTSEDRTR